MVACNVCEGTSFVPGPDGRMSSTGLAPECATCGARERHRRARALTDTLFEVHDMGGGVFVNWGDQRCVAKDRFAIVRKAKLAAEGEPLLRTLPDQSVTFVSCLNVLQSVEAPRQVIADLARVLTPEGMAILAYPNPMSRSRTVEFADGGASKAGARRVFGRDFEPVYAEIAPELIVFRAEIHDPFTRDRDLLYVGTKDPRWLQMMFRTRLNVQLLD